MAQDDLDIFLIMTERDLKWWEEDELDIKFMSKNLMRAVLWVGVIVMRKYVAYAV